MHAFALVVYVPHQHPRNLLVVAVQVYMQAGSALELAELLIWQLLHEQVLSLSARMGQAAACEADAVLEADLVV